MKGHPRQKFSIGLKRLLFAAGGGILFCFAAAAVLFLEQAQETWREAQTEAKELARYETVLLAVSAISSERWPSNTVMTSNGHALAESLQQKRIDTDKRLADMLSAYRSDLSEKGLYFRNYALLEASLRNARVAVDRVAALTPGRRDAEIVADAVHALFSSADAAFVLRDRLGSAISTKTPDLTAEILLLNEAGALRELTGRLGSHAVLLLGVKSTNDERVAMDAIKVKLEVLWHDLQLYSPAHLKAPQVRAAIEATNQSFFLGSLPYLAEVLRLHANGRSTPARTFTDRYVVGLKAADDLCRQIIRATIEGADRRAREARRAVYTGIASFVTICLLVLGFGLATSRLLFAPLLLARDQILALAADNLDETPRRRALSRELEEIFGSLSILRRQLVEKKAMEQEQQRLTETLRFLSERDPLTQLLNRRTVEDIAAIRLRDADINKWSLGVLIVDLDHFKRINDTYGHTTGDLVLKTTTEQMKRTLRSTDIVARFGGEEFLIILDLSDGAQAVEIAERLHQNIAAMAVEHEAPISVTASVGLCIRAPGTGTKWDDVITIADRRLYSAKALGRNRVCANDEIRLEDSGHPSPPSRARAL